MVKSFRYIANILSLDTVKNSLRLQKAFRSYVITERLVEDFLLDIVFLWCESKQQKVEVIGHAGN